MLCKAKFTYKNVDTAIPRILRFYHITRGNNYDT